MGSCLKKEKTVAVPVAAEYPKFGPKTRTTQKRGPAPEYDYLFKILLIGDSGVGKSSMLLRYTDDVFHDSFISTIGVDFKLKTIPIPSAPSQTAKLQIWDTAGQERFRTITSSIYRGASGVFVVFDVSDRDSFTNVSRWMQDAQRYTMDNTPMLLVGNKIDTDNRVVSQEEAQALAQNLGMGYVECSCRNSVGVNDAFLALTESCFRKFNAD
eukprot:TRINITY_DN1549_c0_g1_i1.p2 TRINITY_DN1549_c0_g1~~TRINITY_DN1549_c0_g1_i1.p2  ORF type:complete len:212 (-),score=43.63 TRINITY_DN1549_c0_g1_i1:1561-2196(-)